MAKGNGNKKQAAANGSEKPLPAYFKSLTIENVKCFRGKHTIDLSDGKGKPAQWTVILGNNNTGKTTILKCLAGLEPIDYFTNARPMEGQQEESFLAPYIAQTSFPDEFYTKNLDFKITSEIFFCGNLSFNLLNGVYSTLGNFFWGKDEVGFPLDSPLRLAGLKFYSYGASRKMSKKPLSESQDLRLHSSLFDNEEITNVEDWLLNLFLAKQLKQEQAKPILELAKEVLASGILPDVQEVDLDSSKKGTGFENYVKFKTDFGWIRFRHLGYGYQTMIAWVLDLVKRMVERYPGSPNPLAEPAIVLVDEIDLHLHPDWQRRIISHLTKYFPNTQFIVTAHSPLIVQSAEEINLVILKKEGESVHIEQPKIRTFRGWTVEEILTDLMALEGQTMSQTYLDLMQQFDDALDADDYEKAEAAYGELDKILHPNSHQRKLLQLQMTSLSPADAV
ncbi:MAG TPA: AAA family ATPase [Saprospiraceae bacterium]|nr:AAA family ATPase [Saprospiraceae bacterium]